MAKVVTYRGNPLAIDYAELLAFTRAFFRFSTTRLRGPSRVLVGQALGSAIALDDGWRALVDDGSFPTLPWSSYD